MKDQLKTIKQEAEGRIKEAKDEKNLKELEVEYLGRKGKLTSLLRGVKDLPEEEKKEVGQEANRIKEELNSLLAKKKEEIVGSDEDKSVDVTLPGQKIERGHLNPITILQNELEDLFTSMGFRILDGPELESDYFNFEALNIPPEHPARDMQDTFYIDGSSLYSALEEKGENDLVMRTHTSPVQVRGMLKYGAPFRGVVPGRVFRNEDIDACHEQTFDQMEGLMVDENISISNLIAVLKELINKIFGKEMEVRVRPGFFPFVEPGIEMDIKCTICGGAGCPSCKNSGWLELIPGGMVHPKVLEYGGIDPKKYSGFAFGLGLTRLAMMRYGIEDIRMFNSGDMRFLEQF
jgi:phenylalanyl-tRNA synthetase alpha chain